MFIYAICENDEVINVVLCDDTTDPATIWPDQIVRRIEPPAGIGWMWNASTNTFDPPAAPPVEPTP